MNEFNFDMNTIHQFIASHFSNKHLHKSTDTAYDLHIHSSFSDGRSDPNKIAKKASQQGIGIAITDHNSISGSVLAYEKNICPVIPAIEAASAQGLDLLIYFNEINSLEEFYKDIIEKNKTANPYSFTTLSAMDILREANSYGGFSVLAHPFGILWKNWSKLIQNHGNEIKNLVSGIECFNAALSWRQNVMAFNLAYTWGKPVIGGSDSHIINTVGDAVTIFNTAPEFNADFFMTGRTTIAGRGSKKIDKLLSHCSMALKHIPFWPPVVRQAYLESKYRF